MANSADPVQKPTDLDLHCFQKQGISGFSMSRVKIPRKNHNHEAQPSQGTKRRRDEEQIITK